MENIKKELEREYLDLRFDTVEKQIENISLLLEKEIKHLSTLLEESIESSNFRINNLEEKTLKTTEEITNLKHDIEKKELLFRNELQDIRKKLISYKQECSVDIVSQNIDELKKETKFSRLVFNNFIYSFLFIGSIFVILILILYIGGFDFIFKILNLIK